MSSSFAYHELPNGLRVVCETLPQVHSAAIGFYVRTGARHERPELHGVSHFLEHMCFKGTPRRSSRDINIRFDDLGSIYNAFTGKEHTVYYGWVPSAHLTAQLELLADMMHPALPAEDFETERKVVLEEIAMSDDSFDRHLWDFLHRRLFGHHPLGHEILGEKETIQGLPREAMVTYHRARYSPQNVIVLAAGAIDPQELFAGVGRFCGDWLRDRNGQTPNEPLPEFTSGTAKLRLERFKQQALVRLYPSVPHGHADAESIEAFVSLFGGSNSRCFWNIVQKGICTGAGAAWVSYADCGLLALYAEGEPERCEEMLEALDEQRLEVAQAGFTAEEVQRVKNRRRTQVALEAENPRTRLMQMLDDIEATGYVRTVEARLAAVEAVSVRSLADYLRRFPITGDGMLLSCGPRDWPPA
jgi:predicted Zn-dependent peptidase